MSVADKLPLLATALTNFVNATVALVTSKRDSADISINADTFDNISSQDLQTDIQEIFEDHVNSVTPNPHNTTVESIDGMYTSEYNDIKRPCISKRTNIVSRYGGFESIDLTIEVEGSVVTFPEDVPLLMDFFSGVVPSISIDLADIKPDPTNSSFSVYVSLVGGLPEYSIEESSPMADADSIDRMRIGYITTNNETITAAEITVVTRIGQYRLSTTPLPDAISVSSGLPMKYAGLDWY